MMEKPYISNSEKTPDEEKSIDLNHSKIRKYLKYGLLLSLLGAMYSDSVKTKNKTENDSEKVTIENTLDAQLKSIEKNDGTRYIPEISNEEGPVIINISERHAKTGMTKVEGYEDIRETVESQKKIEKVILQLMNYAKEHKLKVHFFEDGNFFESSPLIVRDNSKIIQAFLNGIETEDDLNEFINIATDINIDGDTGSYVQEGSRYGFWTYIKRYLDNNQNEGIEKRREYLKKKVEENLSNINMDLVYTNGAILKLIHEGFIKPEDYKKSEDENAINKCVELLIGDQSKFLGYTNLSLKENLDWSSLYEIVEVRENIAVDLMFDDIEKNHSDINIAVFGALHDFKNNVNEKNNKTKHKIGLVRIDTD